MTQIIIIKFPRKLHLRQNYEVENHIAIVYVYSDYVISVSEDPEVITPPVPWWLHFPLQLFLIEENSSGHSTLGV